MIEAKYREIQELYPQIGFLHWKKSIRSFNKISIIYGGQLARRYIQLFVKINICIFQSDIIIQDTILIWLSFA